MPHDSTRRLPPWIVLLAALLGPFLIAIIFLTVFDWVNHAFPWSGAAEASRNNDLVGAHALALLAFVVLGGWRARPAWVRVVFLLIAIPTSALVFLLAFFSLMAP
jgi:hypothetical protein